MASLLLAVPERGSIACFWGEVRDVTTATMLFESLVTYRCVAWQGPGGAADNIWIITLFSHWMWLKISREMILLRLFSREFHANSHVKCEM